MEGFTIVDQPDAQKWTLEVKPNSTEIVLLEVGFSGMSMSGGSSVSIKKL